MNSTRNTTLMAVMAVAVVASIGGFSLNPASSADYSGTYETSSIQGHVTAMKLDSDGNIIQYTQSDNAVLDVGKDHIVDDLFGTSIVGGTTTNNFTYIEVDTGTGAPAESDTALGGANACARVNDGDGAATSSPAGETVATIVATIDGNASSCNGAAFKEAGLFNASTSGEILARNTFASAITLTTSDDLVVTWNITFT